MTEFKPVTFTDEYIKQYWEGRSNSFARYFTYWQRGMGWLNEGRLYFYLVGGGIFTAKFITVFGYQIPIEWIMILAVVGIPLIILIGRWDLYKFNKAREFATVQHGSITKYDNFNMTVRMVEQNDEIIKLLKDLNDNNSR